MYNSRVKLEIIVKKKITTLLLCFVMAFAFLLSGCSLFPKNMDAYLNKSVCTLTYKDGQKEEITTEVFINAFNSYGYSLVQNGTSYEDAKEQTMEVLVSRYVLLHEAKKVVTVSQDEEKKVLEDVYTSLNSTLSSYVTNVRTEWEIDEPSSSEEEESDVVVYTPYEKTAEIVFVDGEYKIKLKDTEKETQTSNFASLDAVLAEFKNYATKEDNTSGTKIRKEAYRRFLSQLKRNEEGRGLSKDNDSILKRYAEKLYDSTKENLLVTKLEEYYKTEEGYSTISVRQVLNKYKTLLLQSKFKYDTNPSEFSNAMLNSFSDVYYILNDEFFFVSHILLKFSDAEQAEYDALQTEYENGYISRGVYNSRLNELVAQIKVSPRNSDGTVDENTKVSASKVLSDLKMELASKSTDAEKAEVFKTYMYRYGGDPGTQNAEYPYVIGKNDSSMVESFTDASRELDEAGNFAGISDLVASQYGVHIIFYEGKVVNLFEVSDVSTFELKDEDILKLDAKLLNPLNNKTMFDKIFEMLSNDKYSIFENMNLNVLKKDMQIEKHKSAYENL